MSDASLPIAKALSTVGVFLCLSACTSVTLRLSPSPPPAGKEISTSFHHHSHYFLWGLVGSNRLPVQNLCQKGYPTRLKYYLNREDQWFALTTLGIYTPKSLRIWCTLPPSETNKNAP